MNPASAQHAALRLFLEDVDPLLQRAEAAAQTLTKVHEELDADLLTLGKLVQQSLDAQPLLLEAGRKLSVSAARIEEAMQGDAITAPRAQNGARISLWSGCTISVVISAVIVAKASGHSSSRRAIWPWTFTSGG